MSNSTLLREVADPSNRANPFPLYARFRESPVTIQDDGSYVVSTYREISSLLHDPRISSSQQNLNNPDGGTLSPLPAFIGMDPPDHDQLRRVTMRQFGPPEHPTLVAEQEPEIRGLVDDTIRQLGDRTTVDIVDDFAYPIPVAVICRLLGVPPEDEPQFHAWADAIVEGIAATDQADAAELQAKQAEAGLAVFGYLGELVARHRAHPTDVMLSRLANDTGADALSDNNLQITGLLLLVAGHETTVNLITNGTLTLLRNPDVLERLRRRPALVVPLVEELLRFEPPVHYLPNRTVTSDVEVAGVTIPKGEKVVLLLAAGSRDPAQFHDAERFIPDRAPNQHFGFGGGVHYCVGAPLARLEAQLALLAVADRLRNPRLTIDPPPYRPNPVLRGPRHLVVDIDGINPPG